MKRSALCALSAAMLFLLSACGADETGAKPDGAVTDAAANDSAANDATTGDQAGRDAVADGKAAEDGGCPPGTVAQKPTVMLIIDRSSSMTRTFGSTTRWKAVREVLVGQPNGLVLLLEKKIRFGIATYHGERKDPVCPTVKMVLPAENNYSAINAVYAVADPVAGTPTAEGVQKVYDDMVASKAIVAPTFFVLATDGLPRGCVSGSKADRAKKSVTTLETLHTAGIQTFVIGVGENAVDKAHLQDLANAGAGKTASDPAKYFEVREATALRNALEVILSETLCTAP